MARTLRSLIIPIIGDVSGLANTLGQAERLTRRFAKQLGEVGQALSEKVTAPLIALGTASSTLAAKYEHSMAQIQAQTGLTAQEASKAADETLELAMALGKSPSELQDAMKEAASAGRDVAESLEITTIATKASVAGFGETNQIVKAVTGTVDAYGRGMMSNARAADIFASTIKLGRGNAQEFIPALAGVADTAAALGIPLEEVAGTLAAMTLKTDSVSVAGTGLQNVLKALVNPTKEAQEALAAVGLSADAVMVSIKERGLPATLMELKERFGDNSLALKQIFTDWDGFKAILNVLGEDTSNYTRILEEMKKSTGTVDEGFKLVSETVTHQWNRAMAAGEVLLIRIGQDVLPHVALVLELVTEKVVSLAKWWKELPEDTRQNIVEWGVLAGSLGPIILGLSGVARAAAYIIGLGTPLLQFISKAAGWFPAIIGSGPKLLGILGIAYAVAWLAVAWEENWYGIQNLLKDVVANIKPLLDELAGLTKRAFESVTRGIEKTYGRLQEMGVNLNPFNRPKASNLENDFTRRQRVPTPEAGAPDTEKAQKELKELDRVSGEAMAASQASVDALAQDLSVKLPEATRVGKDMSIFHVAEEARKRREIEEKQRKSSDLHYKHMLEVQQDAIDQSKRWWEDLATTVLDTVGGAFGTLFETIKRGEGIMQGVVEGLKSIAVRMLDVMATQLIAQKSASIASAIAQAPFTGGASLLEIPGIAGAAAAGLLAIEAAKAGIAMLADGGRVISAGMALVGERGPELLSLPRGAQVAPLGAGGRIPGGGGTTVILEVDGRTLAEILAPHTPGAVRWRVGGGGL